MTDDHLSTDAAPNIDARGRQRRLVIGIAACGVAAALALWLLATHQPRLARLAVLPLAYGAALGVFQARAKT